MSPRTWPAARGDRIGPSPAAVVETKEGEKRTVYEVEVDDVGPSLRNASAKVNKVARSGGYGGGQRSEDGGRSSGGGESDPWAADGPGGYSDEPPPFWSWI